MTPDTLLNDIVNHAKREELTHQATTKCRIGRDTSQQEWHIYNIYKFDYLGDSVIYCDKRIGLPAEGNYLGWQVSVLLRSTWGKIKLTATYQDGFGPAQWINTPAERIMLYKLSRP